MWRKNNKASFINDNTSKSSNIYYNEIYCYLIQHIKQKNNNKYVRDIVSRKVLLKYLLNNIGHDIGQFVYVNIV